MSGGLGVMWRRLRALMGVLAAGLCVAGAATAADGDLPPSGQAGLLSLAHVADQHLVAARQVLAAGDALGRLLAAPTVQPRQALRQARGVLIFPACRDGPFDGGDRARHGVLLLRQVGGQWGGPAFYRLSGGPAPSARSRGDLLVLLNSAGAVERIASVSVASAAASEPQNAAGGRPRASVPVAASAGEVLMWPPPADPAGGQRLGELRYHPSLTRAYYRRPVAAAAAIAGHYVSHQDDALRRMLADVGPDPPAVAVAGRAGARGGGVSAPTGPTAPVAGFGAGPGIRADSASPVAAAAGAPAAPAAVPTRGVGVSPPCDLQ